MALQDLAAIPGVCTAGVAWYVGKGESQDLDSSDISPYTMPSNHQPQRPNIDVLSSALLLLIVLQQQRQKLQVPWLCSPYPVCGGG